MTHSKCKNLSRHSLGAASNEAGRRRIQDSKFSLPRYDPFTAKPGFVLTQVIDVSMNRRIPNGWSSPRYLNYIRLNQPLLSAGLLEMTFPEKPNSRLQNYRLTGKGRFLLTLNPLSFSFPSIICPAFVGQCQSPPSSNVFEVSVLGATNFRDSCCCLAGFHGIH